MILKDAIDNIRKYKKIADLKNDLIKKINKIENSKIDYVSIASPKNLEEISGNINQHMLISIAVFISEVRLIDNITYQPDLL